MSELAFADTNLFIRLITKDDPVQTEAVISLLKRAGAGEVSLVTNVTVIAELVWVMESRGADQTTIRDAIWSILNTPGIQVDASHLVAQAIDIYAAKNIDFVDAYNISWMFENDLTTAYTFDRRHFSRVAGVDVIVPGQTGL